MPGETDRDDRSPSGPGTSAGRRRFSHVPVPAPLLVARPRLYARLDVPASLTLVQAPVGFGKTTLVAQWLRERREPDEVVAWLRVRPGAGDSTTFWINALQVAADAGLDVPPAIDTDPLVDAGDRLERAALTADVPVVLVVDGYEHVTSTDVDLALLDVLRHTPNLRLVVCLRSYRRFPANSRLDLRTTVLTTHELYFTKDETRGLLAVAGVDFAPDQLQGIVDEFRGWPEPTRELVLRLRDSPQMLLSDLTALAQEIAANYLREQIIADRNPPALVEFAMVTSLPESFSRDVAELLTGDDSASSHLDALGRGGLLMAEVRGGKVIYHWPAAARQALLDELERRWPRQLRGLHQRLARWYVDQARLGHALRHAVSAADWPLVIEIIESSWRVLLFQHNEDLYRAFSALPTQFLMNSPRALATRDITMRVPDDLFLETGRLPESTAELRALGRRRDAGEVLDTCLAMLLAWRLRGEFETARTYADRALTIAAAAHAPRAGVGGVSELYPAIQLQAGVTYLLTGDFSGAIHPLLTAFEWGADNPRGYIVSDAAGKLALTHAIVGDHAQATTWVERHTTAATWGNTWLEPHIRTSATLAQLLTALDQLDLDRAKASHDVMAAHVHREEFWALVVHARAQYALTVGAAADALGIIDRARTTRGHLMGPGSLARPLLAASEADLLMALGRGNLARGALARGGHDHPILRVPQARLALLAGQNDAAMQMTQDSNWERASTARRRVEMLLIRSVAAARIGDLGVAETALRRAVDAARAGGILRSLTTVPRDELLALAARVPAARELLESDPLAQQPDLFPPHIQLIELSTREREVLQQLADGLTVPEIADSSVLSYNTVRTQQRSLYKKLGTSDRPEAIARARQLGLLTARPGR